MMNLLLNGKAHIQHYPYRPVGAQVTPAGSNPNHQAWISLKANQRLDFNDEQPRYIFNNFEVEYIELDEHYQIWDPDIDVYMVKRETYYNIKTESELETLLSTWLSDFTALTHIGSCNHPDY